MIPMCEEKGVTVEIPLEVLKANYDRRGYFCRHRWHYQRFKDRRGAGRLAWEALEAELGRYCLPGRYSSYAVFLSKRSDWIRTKLK